MTHCITDNSVLYTVYLFVVTHNWQALLITMIKFQLRSVLVWVGILSSLVMYSMVSDDAEWKVYWHRQGGEDLYVVSAKYLWLAL